MPTLFTKIVQGQVPCHKILEDENYFAFLEIRPLRPGHTLVIPKKEVDYLFDMDDALMSGIFLFSRKIAKAIQKVTACEKVAIVVYGLQVRHAHVHLVPVTGQDGELNFANQRDAKPQELAAMAEKIKSSL